MLNRDELKTARRYAQMSGEEYRGHLVQIIRSKMPEFDDANRTISYLEAVIEVLGEGGSWTPA